MIINLLNDTLMKAIFLLVSLCAPVWGWGQSGVNVGVYVGGFDCNMAGDYTGTKSRAAFGGSVWVEWVAKDWWGLKSELSYMPRGGDIFENPLRANYLAFALVSRLHLADVSGPARLVVGAGMFTHLMSVGERDALLSVGDVGPCMEIGVELGRVSLLAKGQIGLVDVLAAVPERQRWVSFGIGVEVAFFSPATPD